ncbi:MAG: class I SAM-dependent methyltransferase [archaeon]
MDQKKWSSYFLNQSRALSENEETARIYSKPLNSCKKVLDIGCGEGITLQILKEKGVFSVGITINRDDSKKVNSKGLNVILADMHELPFKDESFDGVYLKDSFEHSFAPFIASREFSRVLKEKGKCVIVLPEERWLLEEYHFHYFTPFQLKVLLAKNNLFLKDSSFTFRYDFYVFEKNRNEKLSVNRVTDFKFFIWSFLRKRPMRMAVQAYYISRDFLWRKLGGLFNRI